MRWLTGKKGLCVPQLLGRFRPPESAAISQGRQLMNEFLNFLVYFNSTPSN
jgi:hypothetical protein